MCYMWVRQSLLTLWHGARRAPKTNVSLFLLCSQLSAGFLLVLGGVGRARSAGGAAWPGAAQAVHFLSLLLLLITTPAAPRAGQALLCLQEG